MEQHETISSLIPRLLPSFLLHIIAYCIVCNKKLGRNLGTRLSISTFEMQTPMHYIDLLQHIRVPQKSLTMHYMHTYVPRISCNHSCMVMRPGWLMMQLLCFYTGILYKMKMDTFIAPHKRSIW